MAVAMKVRQCQRVYCDISAPDHVIVETHAFKVKLWLCKMHMQQLKAGMLTGYSIRKPAVK